MGTRSAAWASLVRRVTRVCVERADVLPADRRRVSWLLSLAFSAPFEGKILLFIVGKGGENILFTYATLDGKICGKRKFGYPVGVIDSLNASNEDIPLYAWKNKKGKTRVSHLLSEAQRRARDGHIVAYDAVACKWVVAYKRIVDLTDSQAWMPQMATKAKKTRKKRIAKWKR